MSMSTHVVGFRPADAKWDKMKAVYEACQAAGTDIPASVMDFFDHESPGDKPGMEVNIKNMDAVEEWRDDMREGYQIDLTQLPSDIRYLRFYNAY